MKHKFITLLCTCLISIISMDVFALVHQEVVKDSYGNFVRTRDGDCIRTKEQTTRDPCRATTTTVAKRDVVIEEIMGMEERIIYFDFASAELKDSEKEKLQAIADVLKKHNIKAVKIVGYADKIGSDEYNRSLSQKRATAAKQYLNSLVKLNSSIVEVRALAKSNQIAECSGIKDRPELIECLAPNRRVEIEIDYKDTIKKVL